MTTPMSEIDDIFSGKPKGKASVPSGKVASSSDLSSTKDKKKKKKKKIIPDAAVPTADSAPVASAFKKRPAPETVVDTSHNLPGPSKRHKGDQPHDDAKKPTARTKKGTVDPDTVFKDSRGTSGRRKTEEGWSVYKEDELGIGDEGGDTPLCPFDCDCCF